MIYKGVPVSPGIALGKVHVLERYAHKVYRRSILTSEIKSEIARFRKAISETGKDLIEIEEKVHKALGSKKSGIFKGHRFFLEDKILVSGTEDIIRSQMTNAEFAFSMTLSKITSQFLKIKNDYLKERARDISELGGRIMAHLSQRTDETPWDKMRENSIIVAGNITPADTTNMKANLVAAFVTEVGGRTSHTAILARALEIPAVTGLKDITMQLTDGQGIIVDGISGIVITDPDEETVTNYKREKKKYWDEQHSLQKLVELPTITKDGKTFHLLANIEIPEEIQTALAYGAEGVGLYRSEYLFINSSSVPTEEEQYLKYKLVAEKMLPYPVIIRTIDLGADKLADSVDIPDEPNPTMGLRSIRLCFRVPEIFKNQLRALLRASVSGNLKIMIPMITNVSEIIKVKTILEEIKRDLKEKNIPYDGNVQFGVMIEVPSAALMVDLIAAEVDFISIGTNDLAQYILAADRSNENVRYIYEPMNSAVLRLIKYVIKTAHEHKTPVAMCGEMASDPAFTKLFIGMGLDEFSMSAISIPKIKKIIRMVNYEEACQFANKMVGELSLTPAVENIGAEDKTLS
ncbi:MAG: phosphoenolpyruvate--protein phosphotransferase [Elusimicrobia bacterium CG08_land_8_20_14_0_20_44_26]|nr:MAG: phosphoenolpyruvate--protein phosphotransferase [Elusimicrobia bacterium CG08_land_8_20_14_0_20_44_26]